MPPEASAEHRSEGGHIGPLPPHAQLLDFLPEADHDALVAWALGQEARFKPARIFYGKGGQQARIDPAVRQALKLRGAGPLEPVLEARLLEALPDVMAAAGYRGPEPRSLEFEMNAYGDGAHFAPHIDIPIGPDRTPIGREDGEDRVISSVYYFHSEPRGFDGGALRLYRFGVDPAGAGPNDSVALEPIRNSLVVFPSWAKHGVEPVSCPSGRFADFRFALNCWFCRPVASRLASAAHSG